MCAKRSGFPRMFLSRVDTSDIMAKVYAVFYQYDSAIFERSKQQCVPVVLVAKCGTSLEAEVAKSGNLGKRYS
jgi:chitin synthase